MKRFLLKTALTIAGAGAALLLLNFIYGLDSANRYHELDKFGDIAGYERQILVSNVGSSHGEYDFVYDALRGRGYTCFNFGLSSQNFAFDYAVLQQYRDTLAPGGILFIPVSYFSFNDEVVSEKEEQERSVRYYQFLEPRYIPDYDWFVDLTTHRLPVLTAQEKLLKLLPDLWEQSRAAEAGGDGTAAQAAGQDGGGETGAESADNEAAAKSAEQESGGEAGTEADEDGAAVQSIEQESSKTGAEADGDGTAAQSTVKESGSKTSAEAGGVDAETVARFEEIGYERYVRHFSGKDEPFEPERMEELRQIIRLCREQGVTPVLVTPPYTKYYTKYIQSAWLRQFHEVLAQLCAEEDVAYYDYGMDARFTDSLQYFGDPDHLNTEGALYFMQLLEQEVPAFAQVLAENAPQ